MSEGMGGWVKGGDELIVVGAVCTHSPTHMHAHIT